MSSEAKYVSIILKNEWMGHPRKSKLSLVKSAAEVLISRGVARLDKRRVNKELEGPAKDKMVRKKLIRTK